MEKEDKIIQPSKSLVICTLEEGFQNSNNLNPENQSQEVAYFLLDDGKSEEFWGISSKIEVEARVWFIGRASCLLANDEDSVLKAIIDRERAVQEQWVGCDELRGVFTSY